MTTLIDADFERAAKALKVPLEAVRAVCAVESNGSGMQTPTHAKVLFERHVMYRQLNKIGRNAAAIAARGLGVVDKNPGGYQGGPAEITRLNIAKKIDGTCAIEATSWGLFQIMGYHWRALGYDSAQNFEAKMNSGEPAQLDAFIAFMGVNKLGRFLKALDWAGFAHAYNGPNYKQNHYDGKLAAAYAALTTNDAAQTDPTGTANA